MRASQDSVLGLGGATRSAAPPAPSQGLSGRACCRGFRAGERSFRASGALGRQAWTGGVQASVLLGRLTR
eukprot:13827224-Alexandrium_andersonii.AAC.1